MVVKKKIVSPDFPKECCGVCKFYHAQPEDGMCFGSPPIPVFDGEGVFWMRGGLVEPQMPSCHLFQPKFHG